MVRVRSPGEPVGPSELVWLGLWRLRRLEPVRMLLATLADESADGEAADWLLRAEATRVLGKLGDRRSVGPLVHELGHEHATVRHAAAEALGTIGNSTAVEPLARALRDEAWRVRRSAARSLVRLGTPKAVAALRSATHLRRRARSPVCGPPARGATTSARSCIPMTPHGTSGVTTARHRCPVRRQTRVPMGVRGCLRDLQLVAVRDSPIA
jgi:hypothetical protein